MCGIIGVTGMHPVDPVPLDGLSKQEYRGYDSVGLAIHNGSNNVEIVKTRDRPLVCWQKKQTMERLLQEPVAWGIPVGPPMENPVKPMSIPLVEMTTMWSGYIMVSLRITRS